MAGPPAGTESRPDAARPTCVGDIEVAGDAPRVPRLPAGGLIGEKLPGGVLRASRELRPREPGAPLPMLGWVRGSRGRMWPFPIPV